MTPRDPDDLLTRVALFKGLADAELADLRRSLRARTYRSGQSIFMKDDPGNAMYIVAAGRIKLTVSSSEGREMIMTLFNIGDFFGELAVLDGSPRSADCWAMETSTLWLLEREEFWRVLRAHPRIMEHLLLALAERLRRDAGIIQDATFYDVPARVARTLLRLSGADSAPPGAALVVPRMRQTDLAGMVGTTRETLNSWLGKFEEQKLIRRNRETGAIEILQAEGLRKRIY